MAEINVAQKTGRRKVQAPRIDLTPMVDLGFLLITFFMYTTTMAKPKTMEINMPDNSPTSEQTAFVAESTITLVLAKAHKVIYYNGILEKQTQLKSTFIENNGLRNILLAKVQEVQKLPATFSKDAHKLHVLIKPSADCTYDDVVATLDEMNILAVPYYAITDETAQEVEWVKEVLSR